MLTNYIKIALRNLRKNKAFSSINIVGFAFSISICMIIVLYLLNEYSYDKYNKNAESIYKLVDAENNYCTIDYRVSDILTANYPQIKNATIIELINNPIEINNEEKGYYISGLMSTDNSFFEMFDVDFIDGNPQKPFENINSVVINESTSKQLFGNENPIGKEILFRHDKQLIVTAVIKDLPNNSSIKPNIMVNAENDDFKFQFSCGDYADKSSHRWLFNIYVQLDKNIDPLQLTNQINSKPEIIEPYESKLVLLPLTDMYLYDYSTGGQAKKGNSLLLYLMTGIAIIILVLAIINYVNITIARQAKRNKEVGIRKTIGAKRKDMITLFLVESVAVTLIAFIFAIVFLQLVLPIFSSIVNSTISTEPLLTLDGIIIILSTILVMGILAGIVPAILLSSFEPAKSLRSNFLTSYKKGVFRNALTVFQFAISIALIFCVIVIQKQISYVKDKDPGFNKEQLLSINMPGIQASDSSKATLLFDKLRQFSGIKNLSITSGSPGFVNNRMGSGVKDKDQYLYIIAADSSYLKTFEIEQVMGRPLQYGDMGNVCMLNEAAYNYFGWTDLNDKIFNNGKPGGYKVIGVVKDFNYASMHNAIQPMCVIFDSYYPTNITVKIQEGAVRSTMNYLEATWKEILPEYALKYQFYDDWFDSLYRQEDRLAQSIGLFTVLAIIISCLGILGLAIFSSENRSKEIGIRKVYGAGINDLLLMLNRDYVKWVVISFVLACPISWYIMNNWLDQFAYRTDIEWWVFVLSGVLALVIALATISLQTYKAATANPVESLRNE